MVFHKIEHPCKFRILSLTLIREGK
jgi:hypothetical protein